MPVPLALRPRHVRHARRDRVSCVRLRPAFRAIVDARALTGNLRARAAARRRAGRPGSGGQRPLKTGVRFSAKARAASRVSSSSISPPNAWGKAMFIW